MQRPRWPNTSLQPFVEIAEGNAEQRAVFAFRRDVVQSARTGKRLVIDRLFARDWVNVVAFTTDDEILLVRQWRFGTRSFTVELPAGVVEDGEDPLVAGVRELAEETGFAPSVGCTPRLLGTLTPNAGFLNNRCAVVLVERCALAGPQRLDDNEEIEVLRLPRGAVEEAIRDGTLHTALFSAALMLARVHAPELFPR